jgi:hypothetical protein
MAAAAATTDADPVARPISENGLSWAAAVSAALHGLVLLLALFGLPHLVKPLPPEDRPLVVEALPLAAITNAPPSDAALRQVDISEARPPQPPESARPRPQPDPPPPPPPATAAPPPIPVAPLPVPAPIPPSPAPGTPPPPPAPLPAPPAQAPPTPVPALPAAPPVAAPPPVPGPAPPALPTPVPAPAPAPTLSPAPPPAPMSAPAPPPNPPPRTPPSPPSSTPPPPAAPAPPPPQAPRVPQTPPAPSTPPAPQRPQQQNFQLDSVLRDLTRNRPPAQESQAQRPQPQAQAPVPAAGAARRAPNAPFNPALPLTSAEEGALRGHVESRWNKDRGAKGIETFVVEIRVWMGPGGVVQKAEIESRAGAPAASLQAFAESARRAVLIASPLPIPVARNDLLSGNLILTFRGIE